MWIQFLDRLHEMTAQHATSAVQAMTDDDVLAFWQWNDREAAIHIRNAEDAAELREIADELREALLRDTLREIEFRNSNT